MTADVENLMLEHLRAIRGELTDHRRLLVDLTVRVNDIGVSLAGMRRDQAHDAEVAAHLAARVDRLQDQIERINRRLDLTDN